MGFSKAGDKGPQVRACDPVETARPQNPCAEAAFSGDHQDTPRALSGLPDQKTDQLATGAVLRMPVKIKARVNDMLSAADASLPGEVLRRAWTPRPGRADRRGRGGQDRPADRPIGIFIALDAFAGSGAHSACDL